MPTPASRFRRPAFVRSAAAAILLMLAAGVAGPAVEPPPARLLMPVCPWWALTGLRCPGCGMSRAIHHLAHGELGLALGLNPVVLLVPPALAVVAGVLLWSLWTGRWPRLPRPPMWVAWAAIGFTAAIWLWRTVVDLMASRAG